MKEKISLTVKFPRDRFPELKMLLAKKRKTLIDFATELLLKEIEKDKQKQGC